MTIDFKGSHHSQDVTLYAAFFYVRHGVSYRDLEEVMAAHGDEAAATVFFARAIGSNGFPDRGVIDTSGAYLAGLQNINCLTLLNGWCRQIGLLPAKYLNNIIEQDRRFIKKLTRQMKGFKSFRSTSATLESSEDAHMSRKRQFSVKTIRFPAIRRPRSVIASSDTRHPVVPQSLRGNTSRSARGDRPRWTWCSNIFGTDLRAVGFPSNIAFQYVRKKPCSPIFRHSAAL